MFSYFTERYNKMFTFYVKYDKILTMKLVVH